MSATPDWINGPCNHGLEPGTCWDHPIRLAPRLPGQRDAYDPRRGRPYIPGPDCAVCGMKRINAVHEMDPENSPEGPAYHAEFTHHAFVEASK